MDPTATSVDLGFTRKRYPAGTHMSLIYRDARERASIIGKPEQFLEKHLHRQ